MKTKVQIDKLEREWVEIGKFLPPTGFRLLVATGAGHVWPGNYSKTWGCLHQNGTTPIKDATHWRLWPRNPNQYFAPDAAIELETSN